MHELPPLSLYVHIPWCVRKCPYCDFNSHAATDNLPEAAYVAALQADLESELPLVQGRQLKSIFFGGGTPSLFSASAIGAILDHAERVIGFDENIEITLEANPGTFEQAKFHDYWQAGINRLSIGIQSFQAAQLSHLGRIHSAQEAIAAVAMARRAGFDNLNLDLMHGLPEQTPALALADLQQAIDLTPEHLSWYQLTIEPNTEFFSQPPLLPVDDILADIQDQGQSLLAQQGYQQYEISAYSQPLRRSVHNTNYWRFGDYLGIGAGAHGKVTIRENGEQRRRRKTRLPQHYLDTGRDYCVEDTPILKEDLPLEFLMNALRLVDGVELDLFIRRTGLSIDRLQPTLNQLRQQALLCPDEQRIATTPLGSRYLNTVLQAFL